MPTVAIIATLDTKGREAQFLRDQVRTAGADPLVIDTGIREPLGCTPDISRHDVAAAGGADVAALATANDRGQAVTAMGEGLRVLLGRLVRDGEVQAVLGIGGSGGTSIAATACRALPTGFPKLIVSTVAGGPIASHLGTKDITLMPSVADIEGLNRISIPILTNAAAAAAGMARSRPPDLPTRPLIGLTMFGVTTPCVKAACAVLERAGYEPVVFHAVGTGGKAFESLITDGFFAGVLDVTTTEWADELVGGVLSAGPERLDAAGRTGTPQVVCPGALDMVNFGPRETVPAKFAERKLYLHNPQVTLMRTTPEENRRLGEILARKLNATTGPTTLALPLRGVSAMDNAGQPFDDPEARAELRDTLRLNIDRTRVELLELDLHINDPDFAEAIAKRLLAHVGHGG
ncbi:MAG: hypothetical protein AMXMBFR13_30060 [Phycisphaerae bacterium]